MTRTLYTLFYYTHNLGTHQKKEAPDEIYECIEKKYKNTYLVMARLGNDYLDPPLEYGCFSESLRVPHRLPLPELQCHLKN
jgi:hypothetical protein